MTQLQNDTRRFGRSLALLMKEARKDGRIITLKCESDSPAYDQQPREIIVSRADDQAWHGRPVDNPACPELTYPRYAWKEV